MRPTECKDCGSPIDNSDLTKKSENACTRCQSISEVARRQNKRVKERKAELLALNERLSLEGYRVCGKCFRQKLLEEFSNSKGQRATRGGIINKLCDSCLTKYYSGNKRPSTFTDGYLRARAYSVNTRAAKNLSTYLGRKAEMDELSYFCKPQDLIRKLEHQGYLCFYCREPITTSNFTVEHTIPLSKGIDYHNNENLTISCDDCNHLKHRRTGDEFAKFVVEYAKRILSLEQQDKKSVG